MSYSRCFETDFISLNNDFSVTFPRLMNYAQEASLLHPASLGRPLEWFRNENRGWLVISWHVKVGSYPAWNSPIKVTTWPSRFKGFLGERAFTISEGENRPFFEACSRWIFSDIEKKTPVRMSAEEVAFYGEIAPPVFDADFSIPQYSNMPQIAETVITVSRRDIDTNFHANNVKYIEWAMELFPLSFNGKFSEFKASYRKECVFGDEVKISLYEISPDEWAAAFYKEETLVNEMYFKA